MFDIRPIKETDYSLIQILFRNSFQIKSGVPPDYIANLCYSEPNGCFIGILDEIAIGYICVHTAGRIGYIGNLAVDPAYQGCGYGKALVEKAIEYLIPKCDVIGLVGCYKTRTVFCAFRILLSDASLLRHRRYSCIARPIDLWSG
jgi:ribosomal protein S18 acetylase RimI-like enzyme